MKLFDYIDSDNNFLDVVFRATYHHRRLVVCVDEPGGRPDLGANNVR
jgi:hypothetical protein